MNTETAIARDAEIPQNARPGETNKTQEKQYREFIYPL